MVNVEWKGGMAFEASAETGAKITMDAYLDSGGQGLGPTPLQTFLGALAACSAMDVVSILSKMRQEVTSYHIEVDGDRAEPGTWPRPYTKIRIKHVLSGKALNSAAVEKAIQLSDEKYCSVSATLREKPVVETSFQLSES